MSDKFYTIMIPEIGWESIKSVIEGAFPSLQVVKFPNELQPEESEGIEEWFIAPKDINETTGE